MFSWQNLKYETVETMFLHTVSFATFGWFIRKAQASLCIPEVAPLPVNMTTSSLLALTQFLIMALLNIMKKYFNSFKKVPVYLQLQPKKLFIKRSGKRRNPGN